MDEQLSGKYRSYVTQREGCWGWRHLLHRSGYGLLSHSSKNHYAHRISYEMHVGPIPDGMDVMHLCHTPACSNPEHLTVGSRRDNMQSSRVAGRLQRKIPLDDMPLIHARRAAGESLQQIASLYGCSKQAIRHMIRSRPAEQHCA